MGTRERQAGESIRVSPGATVAEVIKRCTLVQRFAEVDPGDLVPAVHGRRVTPTTTLRPGDRLELLRPLTVDPKEARRRRAARRRKDES